MYNKVILMGRICHDLELKTTPNGISVLSFRLAVERSHQAKGEERKSDFFNIVAWRNNAEFINRYFSKGRMIHVDGELQNKQYVDKNNINQTVTEIIVSGASFTGEPKPQSKPPQAQTQANNYNPSHAQSQENPNNQSALPESTDYPMYSEEVSLDDYNF